MDKVTVVSVCPIEINERKPGLYPGHFIIKGAKEGKFEFLHVTDSIYWVHFLEDDRPPLKVTTPANEVADSLIRDYVNNLYGINHEEEAYPGLFKIPKEVDAITIELEYKKELEAARARQLRWFTNLIRLADDSWVTSNKQHRSISSIHRLACKALGLDREWLIEVEPAGPKLCPACKSKIHPEASICPNCRAIVDDSKIKGFKFAGEVNVSK